MAARGTKRCPRRVLVRSAGPGRKDEPVLKACDVEVALSEIRARRAALLRSKTGRGSAVDAVVVATAEPGGTVLTGDFADLNALAAHAEDVLIERL